MSGLFLASRTSSPAGSRSASRGRASREEPIIINDTASQSTPPTTSTPASRSNSASRSSSRSRLGAAVKAVFSSHAPPQDLSFADNKGLERQAREASASRAGSRSNSRAPSPSRGNPFPAHEGSSSRSSSKSRIGSAVYQIFGGHEHHMNFANEAGLERQARDRSRDNSASNSRSASRSASKVRGERIAEEEEAPRGRAEATVQV
ncbi:hypothetical protein BCR35DRAFT_354830 [Leucosporidium creatinivorum]|uniref:Uncharacterized protein n=1 Tax=Leucosporidium creatinivorum TaxID=106004 RepID=A0A1Y2E5D4_9BASI|nr:hypothetical protein BCR35DRAFT_354830 [Leucosporidium creatinivorum]